MTYEMIPAGRYRAKAASHWLDETASGDPQYVVEFEILEDGPALGRTIRFYGALTEAAFPYTVEKLRACGWTGADWNSVELPSEVIINVAHETYNGKTREKVKWVDPADGSGGGGRKPLDADRKRQFASLLNQKLRAHAAATGRPLPPPTTPKAAANGKTDDIPF